MAQKIQIKRGLKANFNNVTLSEGEPAFIKDTGEFYIGNGTKNILINQTPDFPVKSVNGKTGDVTLTPADIGVSYPVTSVNGKTGNVTLTPADVGVSYPVTSVNGKTGAITLTASDLGLSTIDGGTF